MSEAVTETGPVGREEAAGIIGPASLTPFHKGAPGAIGIPLFIVGSIALGLYQINFISLADLGGPLAIILLATGVMLFVTTIWCIALGESIVASVYGIFTGFWLSYAALIFGLLHNWYGAAALKDVNHVVETFLISWLAVIGVLTLLSFRLPLAFSAIFILVEAALACTLIATIKGTQTWHTIAGIIIFVFCGIGMLVFADVMSQAFGGKPVPLGKPIQR